jgi:uracil-DNA glycosylase
MKKEIFLESEWKEVLADYMQSDNFIELSQFVEKEYATKEVFPKQEDVFKAFSLTPFSKVKVVILGQDPYHDDGQACGLCFSVPVGVRVPPSLKNIYKEIYSDTGVVKDMSNGNVESWAKQGVLLLNSVLTVVAHTPASHSKKGWEEFTDTVIMNISHKHEHVIFMLWGKYAQTKKLLIDTSKHYILEAPHPSPFSAYTGFFGCKHFSLCNTYLKKYGHHAIIW